MLGWIPGKLQGRVGEQADVSAWHFSQARVVKKHEPGIGSKLFVHILPRLISQYHLPCARRHACRAGLRASCRAQLART